MRLPVVTFMLMLMIIVLLLLSGCSGLPAKVDTVYVPVHTPCIHAYPVKPELKFKQAEGDIYEQVKALLVDYQNLQIYVLDLETELDGCK